MKAVVPRVTVLLASDRAPPDSVTPPENVETAPEKVAVPLNSVVPRVTVWPASETLLVKDATPLLMKPPEKVEISPEKVLVPLNSVPPSVTT